MNPLLPLRAVSSTRRNKKHISKCKVEFAGRGSSVGCASAWYADGCRFDPHVRQHSFMEISHEIISTAVLNLIQEGQLSVTGERMCTKFCLGGLPRNSVNKLTRRAWNDMNSVEGLYKTNKSGIFTSGVCTCGYSIREYTAFGVHSVKQNSILHWKTLTYFINSETNVFNLLQIHSFNCFMVYITFRAIF